MAQPGHQIRPHGWRHAVAQWVLSVLYGRPKHFISPWTMAGVGVGLIILNPKGDKVLLQQRAGSIEGVGQWGHFGGYLELDQHEDPRTGLCREVWEECARRPDPASLPPQPNFTTVLYNHTKHLLTPHHGVSLYWFAQTPESVIHQLKPSEEASAFQWFTAAQVATLWAAGQIVGGEDNAYAAVQLAFATVSAGQPIPTLRWSNEVLG